MHTIELSDEELRLLHAALHSYLDDFGHDEADILRESRRDREAAAAEDVRASYLEPRRLEDDDRRAAPVSAGRVADAFRVPGRFSVDLGRGDGALRAWSTGRREQDLRVVPGADRQVDIGESSTSAARVALEQLDSASSARAIGFAELDAAQVRDCAANCRGLHEAVSREAARGVEPVTDRADDRMGVRRHVVEARPRAGDARPRRRRVAMSEPLEPVVEHRFVHRLFEAPARLGSDIAMRRQSSRRRKWKPVSASTTIGRSSGSPSIGSVSSNWRASGRIGSSTPNSPEYAPAAITSRSRSNSRASVRSCTSTPSSAARRTTSRVSAGGSATPSVAQNTAPSTSSASSPRHEARIDLLDRDAELRLELAPLLSSARPASVVATKR